jgi:hypothetical protein
MVCNPERDPGLAAGIHVPRNRKPALQQEVERLLDVRLEPRSGQREEDNQGKNDRRGLHGRYVARLFPDLLRITAVR